MGLPLILLLMIALAIGVGLAAAGVVLAFVAAGILAVLVGVGVVSLSTLVGLSTRSASNAFQTFFLATSSVAGTIAGGFLAFVAVLAFHPAISGSIVVVSGAAVGLVAGVGAGMLFNLCWTRLLARITRRKTRTAFPVIVPEKSLPAPPSIARQTGAAE